MNSESEKKLSMDELMERNRPTQAAQQLTTLPPEVHPSKAEWEEMMDCLYTLGRHAEKQTSHLLRISELPARLPSRAQIDELLKRIAYLEQMCEQAGKPKERSFSLPRLQLPHLASPTWVVLLMSLAALLLLWWGLGSVWNNLSLLLR